MYQDLLIGFKAEDTVAYHDMNDDMKVSRQEQDSGVAQLPSLITPLPEMYLLAFGRGVVGLARAMERCSGRGLAVRLGWHLMTQSACKNLSTSKIFVHCRSRYLHWQTLLFCLSCALAWQVRVSAGLKLLNQADRQGLEARAESHPKLLAFPDGRNAASSFGMKEVCFFVVQRTLGLKCYGKP